MAIIILQNIITFGLGQPMLSIVCMYNLLHEAFGQVRASLHTAHKLNPKCGEIWLMPKLKIVIHMYYKNKV